MVEKMSFQGIHLKCIKDLVYAHIEYLNQVSRNFRSIERTDLRDEWKNVLTNRRAIDYYFNGPEIIDENTSIFVYDNEYRERKFFVIAIRESDDSVYFETEYA